MKEPNKYRDGIDPWYGEFNQIYGPALVWVRWGKGIGEYEFNIVPNVTVAFREAKERHGGDVGFVVCLACLPMEELENKKRAYDSLYY